MQALAGIFFGVVSPVFLAVLIGYIASPRLELQARTLSRTAYYILIPAFVFATLSAAEVQANLVMRMIIFAVVVHLLIALIGGLVAKAMGLSGSMIRAFIILAVFGNVGNFGLPIIQFRLGEAALLPATIYFLAIMITAFIVCVAAASWGKGGALQATAAVVKTPALIAVLPALLVNVLDWSPPILVTRITGLLGAAMVPVMLLTLGAQLADVAKIRFGTNVFAISAVRLLVAPALAIALVGLFGLSGVERGAGIFQTAMPSAVLCSIIAIEYDVEPDFVTTTVLFTTIASVLTLTLLLAIV